MHEALTGLLTQRPVAERATWRSLWDRLGDGSLGKEQAVVLLASLTTRLPDSGTLHALVETLLERRQGPPGPGRPGTVNVVGTGGGPPTFNISTAAALVAAAAGVPVVKSGSRAYTSRLGSVDLLERLRIPQSSSYEQTLALLDRHGIAFTGPFVYPVELSRLARMAAPLGMKSFGGFLNAVGPFLASLPVTAQVTGVSKAMPLSTLRDLASAVTDRRIWLTGNDPGADELLSFTDNVVHVCGGGSVTEHVLAAGRLAPAEGGPADLRPADGPGPAVRHFLDVLAGDGPPAATRTVCLNAAALAVAGGHTGDWHAAYADAEAAVTSGAARQLVERMREDPAHRPARAVATPAAAKGGVRG